MNRELRAHKGENGCESHSVEGTAAPKLPNLIGEVINLIPAASEDALAASGNGISPDPGDDPFCVCAEKGHADFIVPVNSGNFPQDRLRALVIAPGDPIPAMVRNRPG